MVKHQKSILIVYEFKTANGKIKNRCNLRSIESGLGEAYFTKLDFLFLIAHQHQPLFVF